MSYYQHPLDVTGLPSWKALEEHRLAMQNFSMREAFKADPTRFDDLSVSCSGLFLDYSKNLITPETRTLLVNLARVQVEGNGHGVCLELEAAFARDGTGRLAHVVQVIAPSLELVLQIHGFPPWRDCGRPGIRQGQG